jgi:uncharacterized membrane protein YoaK (UPF0700 family)
MSASSDGVVRDSLVTALALASGAVDATSFLALGQVFSSVMTGNLVLLGVAASHHDATQAIHAGVAVAAYAAGVLAGAPLAAGGSSGRERGGTWPPAVTLTLALELCLLVAFSVGWELSPASHRGGLDLALLIVLAAAMGVQSAAVSQLGKMSSTYMTSTLTGVLTALVTRRAHEGRWRDVAALAAVAIGALAAGLLVSAAPAWVPAIVLAPQAAVTGVAAIRFGRRSSGGAATSPRAG